METLRMRNYSAEEERGGQLQAEGLVKVKGTTNNSV